MKKTIVFVCLACLLVIVGVGAAILWRQITPAKTISEICGIKENKIDSITLLRGDDGKHINITDNNEILQILNTINTPTYKYEEKNDYNGFYLEIKFYSSEKIVSDIFILSDEVISVGQKRYKKVSGGFDAEQLVNTYIN